MLLQKHLDPQLRVPWYWAQVAVFIFPVSQFLSWFLSAQNNESFLRSLLKNYTLFDYKWNFFYKKNDL